MHDISLIYFENMMGYTLPHIALLQMLNIAIAVSV